MSIQLFQDLVCVDYTVTKKKFKLQFDNQYQMYKTVPQPNIDELPSYYKSEKYISHTDSNKSLIDKLYQFVKKFTLKRKVAFLNSFYTEEKNVLDIGCGTGEFLLACKNNGWNVDGVEPSSNARAIAESKLFSSEGKGIYKSITQVSHKKYDVITLWHVLEHVPNLEEYCQELKNLLKPNGVLVVAVPNYKSFDAAYYKEFWAAFDVPRHLWHFSKDSIKTLFEPYQLEIKKCTPMIFDAFYVSILSEGYKNGKSNLVKAFCIGLWSNIKGWRTNEYSSQIFILKSK